MSRVFYVRWVLWLLLLLVAVGPFRSHAGVVHVSTSVEGHGTIRLNPSLPEYPTGAVVELNAQPDPGAKFVGWSGDAQGNQNPYPLALTSDKQVTAHFEPLVQYTLTVEIVGKGSVDVPNGNYVEGTQLVLHPLPAEGWKFLEWSGPVLNSFSSLPILIQSNTTLRATFVEPPVILKSPKDLSVDLGAPAVFEVSVEGTEPLTYQWFFQDTALSNGKTASYSIASVRPEDVGKYFVVVSNAFGSARSDSALLKIEEHCEGEGVLTVCDEASLRAAVEHGGLIRFCCNGTIPITQTLVIKTSVSLDAQNHSVILDGADSVRLFEVQSGGVFAATNIHFVRGFHQGTPGVDAIEVGGNVVTPASPGGDGFGGAILCLGGNVLLSGCSFSGNHAKGGHGSVANTGDPDHSGTAAGGGFGGALYCDGGVVRAVDCVFESNSARDGEPGFVGFVFNTGGEGSGGALHGRGGALIYFDQCRFYSNSVSVHAAKNSIAKGGAVSVLDGELHLTRTVLDRSQAIADRILILQLGPVPASAQGGAIWMLQGPLTLSNCVVSGSLALGSVGFRGSGTGFAQGGGLWLSNDWTLADCTLSGNEAAGGGLSSVNGDGEGGGVFTSGHGHLIRSTLAMNSTVGGNAGAFGSFYPDYPPGRAFGGGLLNEGTLEMVNCTLAANLASGGQRVGHVTPAGAAIGGGVFNRAGTVLMESSTVASNRVFSPADLFSGTGAGVQLGANIANTNGLVSIHNSILAYGSGVGCSSGEILDLGFNLCSDASAAFQSGTSFNLTDPLLGPLTDNGGLTWTMELRPESPAVDFGAPSGTPPTDQRGAVRPFGKSADMGAYERGPSVPAPTLEWAHSEGQWSVRFLGTQGVAYQILHSSNLQEWSVVASYPALPSDQTISLEVRPESSSVGSQYFRVRVSLTSDGQDGK